MNDNKPTRPLSHEEGRRIAKQHATATAQELLGLHNSHPDVQEWDSQEFAEAVQYFAQSYLASLVNRGLVTPAT
jgi:hypothetical protein